MRRLQAQFPDELVVIGVHSGKFPGEKITANIRQAAMRHGIHHPVVNDKDFAVWGQYAVRAWPTIMLVNPAGKVVGQQAGEITAEEFAPVIEKLIQEHDAQGLIDREPVDGIKAIGNEDPGHLLNFPAKIIAVTGDRLFVADTGNHRILEVQLHEDGLAGEIVRAFGTGEPGFQDGHSNEARFHDPHGMALHGSTLYVADTENHAIRAIDLVWEQVRTVAGTGQKGRGLRPQTGAPTEIDLRSPWALLPLEDALFIAMAGSHQIWVLIEEQTLGVFAGNGAEALVDGPRAEASFNQPSDLVLAMGHLFVADSEASAIRAITLDEDPRVMTVVGQGLFEFGDMDGSGGNVRLQHPTGLAAHNDLLYVADSYNHKIKTLDPTTSQVITLIGTGDPGTTDGPFAQAELYEPEGLVALNNRLYIADTNNHCIRVADFAAEQVFTLALS